MFLKLSNVQVEKRKRINRQQSIKLISRSAVNFLAPQKSAQAARVSWQQFISNVMAFKTKRIKMPAGAAHRTWFPEMIEVLQVEWNSSISDEELISLRDCLDATLLAIGTERNILPPIMWCSNCQKRHRSKPQKCPSVPQYWHCVVLGLHRMLKSKPWRNDGRNTARKMTLTYTEKETKNRAEI